MSITVELSAPGWFAAGTHITIRRPYLYYDIPVSGYHDRPEIWQSEYIRFIRFKKTDRTSAAGLPIYELQFPGEGR